MIGNDNGTVCIPTGGKHEPLSHINYCWIAKILELLSGGEKVNATPEQLLYLAKWLRSEIEKEKSETTKTEYVFYGLDGRNPQEEPTFDDFIQEGDNITVNKGGSRFNRSQLERVIAKQKQLKNEEKREREELQRLKEKYEKGE